MISKAWDNAVPFDDELKAEIANNTINIIRGYIAKGMARSKVSVLTGEYLANATRDNGFRINDPDGIAHICRIPDRLIQEQRSYKNIYDLNYDAKRAHNKKPRIRRTIGDMEPMDCVVLDVHKINVLVEREDGKAVTPYLLGFLDVATRRCWCELVLIEKRGAVRNYDQITAFMAMAVHPAFGLPKTIYVDNGKEYLFADFLECALKLGVDVDHVGDKERKSQIVHSIPYNAAAKEIEAWFGHFEQHFLRHMQGWIDDDRFDPKRPTLGKLPTPYEGGFSSFSKSMFGLNKSYETFPQKGKLKGKSPSEALQMHINNGWAATIIDPKDFLTAFTRPEKRMLRQGSFQYDSRAWNCDELIQHPNPQITVHVAAFGLGFNELRVDDLNGNFIAIARPDINYEYLDPRGAVESARRSKLWNKTLRGMEANIPDLNIEAELIEYGQQALPVHPNKPDGIVSISDYLPAAEVIIPTTLSPSSKTQEAREEEQFQKDQLKHLKMYREGLRKMKENGLL